MSDRRDMLREFLSAVRLAVHDLWPDRDEQAARKADEYGSEKFENLPSEEIDDE